jgi:predicted enzyme related to lactoylglutathione lyase
VNPRQTYPPGVPCWIDTSQPDPGAALDFYGGLFGWQFDERTPDGAEQRYFVASRDGLTVAAVGSQPPELEAPSWNTYIRVESADDAARAIERAGGRLLMGPFDVPDAGRMAGFRDPAGATGFVWEAKGTEGVELVNAHGSWNFSELHTADREGALRFYGEVFGWEMSDRAADDPGMSFWRSPGYGDFLERLTPGTRARMGEMGAPEGFEDAVAWLASPTEDTAAPRWNVTFGVDDADEAARRAAELGGRVLAEPVDLPWVRMTILSDPAGVVFTASQFVPPEQ